MTTANDARKAHKILDDLLEGNLVMDEEREFLRSTLPELPKQKTLEELRKDVYEKWLSVEGDEWDSTNWGSLEEFLGGLQYQLKDFIDAEPAVPAPTHPEFLETEEDYENAPVGTVVSVDGMPTTFVKYDSRFWRRTNLEENFTSEGVCYFTRRVLRWGLGE